VDLHQGEEGHNPFVYVPAHSLLNALRVVVEEEWEGEVLVQDQTQNHPGQAQEGLQEDQDWQFVGVEEEVLVPTAPYAELNPFV
jgi:hypothetical protein